MKKKIGTAVVAGMLAATPQAKELQTNFGNYKDETQTELADILDKNEQSSEKEISFDAARLKYIIRERVRNMSKESTAIKQLKEYYGEEEFNKKMLNITKEIMGKPEYYGRFDKKGNYSMIDEDGNLYDEEHINELIKNNLDTFFKEKESFPNQTDKEILLALMSVVSAFFAGINVGNKLSE